MDQNNSSNNSASSNLKAYFSAAIIIVALITFVGGFVMGKFYSSPSTQPTENKVLSEAVQISLTPTPTPLPNIITAVENAATPAQKDTGKLCSKYGFAQKWEYLTPYTVKENDNLQTIAREQLKDESRVNEILKLNGAGPYVVGSTLYLPPPSITKSSGNLRQLYGKLWGKDSSTWHLILSSDPNGQGILIPAYLFEKVPNASSYKIGDCLKIFLDDGFEVYSVSIQS